MPKKNEKMPYKSRIIGKEKEKLINELVELRLTKAYSTLSLLNYIKDKYNLAEARSYELIREARVKVADMYNKTNKNVVEDSINRMEKMLENAIKDGNNKLAISIVKELNKVNQLYVEKYEVDMKLTDVKITIKKNKDE